MTVDDLKAIALDAENVHDALATLKWWVRGVLTGASTNAQAQMAESVLGIVTRADSTSDVVAVQLAHERDAAMAAEKGGDAA